MSCSPKPLTFNYLLILMGISKRLKIRTNERKLLYYCNYYYYYSIVLDMLDLLFPCFELVQKEKDIYNPLK